MTSEDALLQERRLFLFNLYFKGDYARGER